MAESQEEVPLTDYESWSCDALKKECTKRKMKARKNTPKAERIRLLREHDRFLQTISDVVEEQFSGSVAAEEPRKTKHCIFRLLNVLFSDAFYERFSLIGNRVTRKELDEKSMSENSTFWIDVCKAFATDEHAYDGLVSSREQFSGIDPSSRENYRPVKLLSL